MDPADIAARALANMDESLYEIDEEISATYNTDDNSAKRMKRDSIPKVPKPKPIQPPPSSLIVSFKNQEGTPSLRQVVALYLSVNSHTDFYLDCILPMSINFTQMRIHFQWIYSERTFRNSSPI